MGIKKLSIEAQAVYGGFYQLMKMNELIFQRPHVIHPRFRKGLDDLVGAGYLTVSEYSMGGALVWKPTQKTLDTRIVISMDFLEKNNFPVTQEGKE